MSSMEPIEYNYISGVERLEMYEPGGYHPVMVDDVLHERYRVMDKLGFGGYSTIWLARDNQLQRYVAIKVNISSSSLRDPQREANVLRALLSSRSTIAQNATTAISGRDGIPKILDEFNIEGPNGTHACYAVAPAQGNLREASFSRLFSLPVARALAAKLAIAVSFIHSQGSVHGDIHLRNVLVGVLSTFDELSMDQFKERFGEPETIPISRIDGKPLPPNVPTQAVVPLYLGKKAQEFTLADTNSLTLCDFGEAFSPAVEQRLGRDCHTPISKRAPEALLQPNSPLSYSSDIWCVGIAIWEIVGMRPLFSDSEPQDEIVAQQIDVLGLQNFPLNWREQWEQQSSGEIDIDQQIPRQPIGEREVWPPLEEAFEECVQKFRKKREAAGVFGEDETRAFLNLMRGMLSFRPEERLTIDEVLKSEWMAKWALPQGPAYDMMQAAN
ncbi:protein kinase [Hypoxylon argillaceum]|nr:protein kinase [Hypoxylon argillaceum]